MIIHIVKEPSHHYQSIYIPDFNTDEEKKDFERGLKDGYAKRKGASIEN